MASKLKKTSKNSPVSKSADELANSSQQQIAENSEIVEQEETEHDEDVPEDIEEDVETDGDDQPDDVTDDEDAAEAPQTGENTDGDPEPPAADEKPAQGQQQGEKRYAGGIPKGRIIPLGEEVSIPAQEFATYAVVTEDVYEEVLPMGSKRISFRRLYRAGQVIPVTSLKRK